MSNKWDENLKPKYFYRSVKSAPLKGSGKEALIQLYRPIIGADALTLYFNLIGDAEDQLELSHLDLLNDLNQGLPQFIQARKRLEGLGLLKTFVKNDGELGDVYLYQLLEPLTPDAFFGDQLMGFLLLSQVGEKRFRQLEKRYAKKVIDTEGLTEITAGFASVYRFSQEAFQANQDLLESAKDKFQTTEEQTPAPKTDELDWEFLMQLAEKKFVKMQAFNQTLQEKLSLYHQVYGLKEMELADLLGEVVNVTDGTIDLKKLEATVLAQKPTSGTRPVPETLTEDEQTRRKNQFLAQGFKAADWETIVQAESYAPMEYLEAIKEAKHSMITPEEMWFVRDTVRDAKYLPTSVINILINYLLVVKKYSTINRNIASNMVAEWSELGLKTPEAAMYHIRKITQAAKEKPATKSQNNYGGRKNYQKTTKASEQIRDWSKYQVENDPDKAAELNRKLAQYLKEGDN